MFVDDANKRGMIILARNHKGKDAVPCCDFAENEFGIITFLSSGKVTKL